MPAQIAAATAFATIFAVVGALSLAAAARWKAARRAALLLAWAMLQHAINEVVSVRGTRILLPGPPAFWTWVATAVGYLIAVPWAMLLEEAVGPGWKSGNRRTWQALLAFAVVALTIDVVTGRPHAANGPTIYVIAAGALVGLVNLLPGVTQPAPDLAVLRRTYLVFLAVVVHDTLATGGWLPWRHSVASMGLLVFVAGLAYTVVSRVLGGQRELQALEHELDVARRIQASLLPAAAPPLDGAEVVFRYVPAAAVAGDLFEFLRRGHPGPASSSPTSRATAWAPR